MEQIVKKTACVSIRNLFIIVAVFFLAPLVTYAQSIEFSPTTGTYRVGKTFPVRILISSPDESVNAVSGELSFPNDKLEVVSLSKSESLVNFWVQEPSFLNPQGKVSFEGVILNPGFSGSGGRILVVNFRVKNAGNALLTFSSGSLLANDGRGTNIIADLGEASFNLGGIEETVGEQTPSRSAGPRITSPTHPDQNIWYQSNNALFRWPVDDSVSGVVVGYGKGATSPPTVSYRPPIASKELTGIEDGIWYFHVQVQTAVGFGDSSHYKFQIDTRDPESFEITELPRKDLTEPRAKFTFSAVDTVSGIDHFELSIDEKPMGVWSEERGIFTTPLMEPGRHVLVGKATDRAGNYRIASSEFVIVPITPPTINEYPRELRTDEILIVKGTSEPGRTIHLFVQGSRGEPSTSSEKADSRGKWEVILERKIPEGVYKFHAVAEDDRGARSNPTEQVTMRVRPSVFLKIGSLAMSFFTLLIPLLALLFFLLFASWYGWHRFTVLRKRLRRDLLEAEQGLHTSFDSLRGRIAEKIEILEKVKRHRNLTEVEAKLVRDLKRDLSEAERVLERKLREIDKDVG